MSAARNAGCTHRLSGSALYPMTSWLGPHPPRGSGTNLEVVLTSSIATMQYKNATRIPMATRAELLEKLRTHSHTQLCIIGGGVHGAALARVAAYNGISCCLLERSDFAAGTSSRSSRMAHGGLRYLETGDVQQVKEGLRAREDLFRTANHLCHPATFLIPVYRASGLFKLKMSVGLTAYDMLAGNRNRRHRFLRRDAVTTPEFEGMKDLDGFFEYQDGLIEDDGRLTLEMILEARLHGATCANYVEALSVKRAGRLFGINGLDRITGTELELSADVVVNCAGPYAGYIDAPGAEQLGTQLRFSQGTHLLFDRPWNGPCLCLPMKGEKGRYYFVLPFNGGSATMVGTTEREVPNPDRDPVPTAEEVEEILERLQRDLPQAGLNCTSLFYGFAGVRAIPLRNSGKGVAQASRRHIWRWTAGGILTLLGGKLTTATWTASEGFLMAVKELNVAGTWTNLCGRPLPGSAATQDLARLTHDLLDRGLTVGSASSLVRRFGIRANQFLAQDELLQEISPGIYRGPLELAIHEEQAITLEDVLRRRLGIEYLPHVSMKMAADSVMPYLAPQRDEAALLKEKVDYLHRLDNLTRLCLRPTSCNSVASDCATGE